MRLNCKEVTRLLASEEWVTARWYDHLLGGLHLFLCDQLPPLQVAVGVYK